jgi:hypothetical protein
MHPRPLALDRIALRAPDQRTIGEQPHRATRVLSHCLLHRVLQLFAGQLLPEVERRGIEICQDELSSVDMSCRHYSL